MNRTSLHRLAQHKPWNNNNQGSLNKLERVVLTAPLTPLVMAKRPVSFPQGDRHFPDIQEEGPYLVSCWCERTYVSLPREYLGRLTLSCGAEDCIPGASGKSLLCRKCSKPLAEQPRLGRPHKYCFECRHPEVKIRRQREQREEWAERQSVKGKRSSGRPLSPDSRRALGEQAFDLDKHIAQVMEEIMELTRKEQRENGNY